MSVTFRFNENLKIRKNVNGANAKTVINAPFISDGSNFNSLCFTASGVMQYDSIPFYDESRYILNFKTDVYSITLPNVVVNGYYHNGSFYLRYDPTSGYTDSVIGVTNKLYADKNGNGVYIFNGRYVNVFDLNDDNIVSLYYSVSLGDNIFIVAKSEYDLTNKKNVLNVLRNQDGYYYMKDPYRNTYCLQYVENNNEYETSFVSYVWYGHWLKQSRRTIVFENGVPDVDESTLNWLSENGSITNDVLITNRDSLVTVANAIREQVGDSNSVAYYYPDRGDTENTFVKKIKQLNNTYTHDGDGAIDKDVLENKTYWRDGEQHTGTMPNWGDEGYEISEIHDPYWIPRGYHDGGVVSIKLSEQNKIISDNIKKGVTILGVTGSNTVIETDAVKNNEFDTLRYNIVTPSTLLEGYGAFISGGIVTGSIKDYTDRTINAPINVRASSSSGKISAQMNFTETVGGQPISFDFARMSPRTTVTVPYSIFRNKEAYPDLKIVHYGGTSLGNRDMHLADAAQYISQNISILGVEGTMPTITDTQLADAVYVDSTNSIINLDTNSGVYVNGNCGFYTTYSNLTTAYNTGTSAVSDKIISSNIKRGSTILGVSGSSTVVDVSDTTAAAGTVFVGRSFYDKDGNIQVGTMAGAFAVKVLQRDSNIPKARFLVKIGDQVIDTDNETRTQAPIDAEIILRIYSLGTTPANFFIKDLSKPLEEQVVASGSNSTTDKVEYKFNGSESYEIKCYAERSQTTGLNDYFISFKPYGSVVDVYPQTTATANDVLIGKRFYNSNGQLTTGTIANNGDVSAAISTKSQTVTVPAGYTSGGEVSIAQSEQNKIVPSNIRSGSTILGVSGNYSGDVTVANATNQGGYSHVLVDVDPIGTILKGSTIKIGAQKEPSTSSPITWWRLYVDGVLTGGLSGSGVSEDDKGKRDVNTYSDDIVINADTEVVATVVFSEDQAPHPIGLDVNVNKLAYSETTATANDVLSDKKFYLKNGVVTTGTLSLSNNKSITNNGVYDAASDGITGFKKVTVNVPIWGNACRLLNNGNDIQYVSINGAAHHNENDEFAINNTVGDAFAFVIYDPSLHTQPVFDVYFYHEDDSTPYNTESGTGTIDWIPTGDFTVEFLTNAFEVRVYNEGGSTPSYQTTTATASDVLSGKTFYSSDGTSVTNVTGSIAINNPSAASNVTIRTNTTDYTHSVASGYYANPTNVSVATSTKTVRADETSQTITGNNNTFLTSVTIDPVQSVYGGLPDSSYIATASDVVSGKWFLGSNGLITEGTYTPSTGGYSCLITSSDQSVPNQYVCVSGNSFTDYYSQTNKHFVASTLSCKASYGPAGTNHVYFNGTEQTLDANNECTVQLVTDVNITITGTPGSGATITITNV